jgi:SAM-dependent methyltransferase
MLVPTPSPDLIDAMIHLFAGDNVLVTPRQREELRAELRHLKLVPGKDMHVLWGLLHQLVQVGSPHGDQLDILNMACGRCEEVFVLSSFFAARMEQLKPESVRFYASDLREGVLMRGKERCAETCRFFEQRVGGKYSPFRYRFRAGDATGPEVWAAFPDQFDVVFFRHQNMYHGMDIWSKIFSNVLQRLKPEGHLIITSYFDREHSIALNVLKSLGAELVETRHNPHSRILVTEGKSVDRHIAMLRFRDTVE